VVNGKSGNRIIKLNSQAREILNQRDELWSYRRDFVSHKFKKEVRRLGIKNARFHDLRRTFGYNLIKQGRPIYEVSKLLGHSSVTTTERHYAPILTTRWSCCAIQTIRGSVYSIIYPREINVVRVSHLLVTKRWYKKFKAHSIIGALQLVQLLI
jgi:hypothetical protein